MMNDVLAAARSRASSLPDDTLRLACEKIIEEVADRVVKQRIGNWTFRDVATWVGREPTDAIVQMCLSILADVHGAPILEMHFLFYDPAEEDPHGDVIPDDAVREAFETGYLVNPNGGHPLEQFERYIAPFFNPLDQLIRELTGDVGRAIDAPKSRSPR